MQHLMPPPGRTGPDDLVVDLASLVTAPRGSHRADPTAARSYLADGRVVHWSPTAAPGTRIAVDAELADQPVPAAMARRFGSTEPGLFWPRWTRLEVCCKLRDMPVAAWLARHGLEADLRGIRSAVLTQDGLVICCGTMPEPVEGRGRSPLS